MAKQLRDKLFEIFFLKKSRLEDLTDDNLDEIKSYDLATLCDYIQSSSESNKIKLNQYLVNTFKGTSPDPNNPFHASIVNYPWNKIYTLNIDDLVENIYSNENVELAVQNEKIQKSFSIVQTELYKLHGCVNHPELGFIFSAEEYADSIINADFKLQKFCNDFYENDVVFVGTEFNEDDISILLKRYFNAGYRQLSCKYFFISPKIGLKLKNDIKNNKQYYHIPWTTEKFLYECNLLCNNMEEKNCLLTTLEQFKFWDISKFGSTPKYYQSKLYYGYAPIWSDILGNWDFINDNIMKKVQGFLEKNESGLISLHGKSYVGKSVIAKRILVNLHHEGFLAYQFDIQSVSELELFKRYVLKLAKR